MKIGTREVGPGHPVFIIAEIGSNHGGSLDRALALIDAAADTGADAAKFQYFRVDRFVIPRENPEALRKYELPDEWLPKLTERCGEIGTIQFLCTAFDIASCDIIDPYVNAHKVGSYEVGWPPYLSHIQTKQKPILISNGLRHDSYAWPWITLQCVSKYPADIRGYLKKRPLGPAWGVSDHTKQPFIVPCAAVALGACVVEKHFTLENAPQTPDSVVSIRPSKFKAMVELVRLTESAVRG